MAQLLFRGSSLESALFSCLMILSISAKVHSQTPKMFDEGAPKINHVDYVTGNVTLKKKLFTIAGFSLSLNYSSEGVERIASTRNLESPTSTTGLGWSIAENKIVRNNKGTGSILDDSYIVHFNGLNDELIFTDSNHSKGYKTYRMPSKLNWLVRYHWATDQWELIDDNGIHFIYGDNKKVKNVQNSTEYFVAWNNWIGSSVMAGNQNRVPSVWNLSVTKNVVGNQVTYNYHQDLEQVGDSGLYYTKACYLSSVKGYRGKTIKLTYASKLPYEYVDPHQQKMGIPGNDKDAYQETFEVKYLSGAELYNYYDELEYTAQLDYSFITAADELFSKRVLKSITFKNSENMASRPTSLYSYYGALSQDNVGQQTDGSFTQFNPSNSALFGALKSYITPEGTSYLYEYNELTIKDSKREIDLIFPEKLQYLSYVGSTQWTHWSAPELFFSGDYVVALYEPIALDCKKTYLQVYEWLGDHWTKSKDELLDGYYYNYYLPYDYVAASAIDSFRDKVMGKIMEIPILSGWLNAMGDQIKDEVKGLVNIAQDLGHLDPEKAVEDFFSACGNVVTDVVKDFEYDLDRIAGEIEELNCQTNTDPNNNCRYDFMMKDLYEKQAKALELYSRKEYHITLQKDFFALVSLRASNDILIYEKDPILESTWTKSAEGFQSSSQNFTMSSGENFVSVLDETSDALYIYSRNGRLWTTDFLWLDMNGTKMNVATTTADQISSHHSRYRSAMTANSNLITVTMKSPNVSDGVKVFLIYPDETMKWHVNSEKVLVNRGLSEEAADVHDAIFGFDGTMVLRSGNSFAALQCYNHLNSAISEVISDVETFVPPLMIGKMLFGSLIDDFVPDYKKVNTTYGITWDTNYQNIRVAFLHSGIGQTDVGIRVDGNTINKIGRAHSLIVGSNDALFPEDGENYSFRYNGNSFLKHQFSSKYYTSAFGPDLSSTVNSNGASYKTPHFYQYNANNVFDVSAQNQKLNDALLGFKTLNPAITPENYIAQSILPALMGTNVSQDDTWQEITSASTQKIPTHEEVDEIINVTTDVVNIVVQIVSLVIPGLGEAEAIEEAAVSSLQSLGKAADMLGNATMVLQPIALDLAEAMTSANPYTTTILNNYIAVNGQLYTRNPDETWTATNSPAFNTSEGKLVGTFNEILPGYYPYTLRNGDAVINKVAILKNGRLLKVIDLKGIPYNNQVVHGDSINTVAGNDAFVSYGPLDPDKTGFVLPNPNRAPYLPSGGKNASERNRHASYKDAQSVRLHRITQGNIKGELTDFVVKRIEINDGYRSRYHYYHFEESQYSASTGISIHGKATDIPIYNPNPILASSSFKTASTSGYIEHFFYNRLNYYSSNKRVGLPNLQPGVSNVTLVEYDSSLYNVEPQVPLYGHPYLTTMYNSDNQVVSQDVTRYKVWEINYNDGVNFNLSWPVMVKGSLKRVDGVEYVHERSYKRYPVERFPLLLSGSNTYSTTRSGKTEKISNQPIYAFEIDPELYEQNQLNLTTSSLGYSQERGDTAQIMHCSAQAYQKVLVRGDSQILPYASYQARMKDDLKIDLLKSYAKAAATDVKTQLDYIKNYEIRLAEIERKLGHYDRAKQAGIAANLKSWESHAQFEIIQQEIRKIEASISKAKDLLESLKLKQGDLNKKLADTQIKITENQNKTNALKPIEDRANAQIKKIQREIDAAQLLWNTYQKLLSEANWAEKAILYTKYPQFYLVDAFIEATIVKELNKQKSKYIDSLNYVSSQRAGYGAIGSTLKTSFTAYSNALTTLQTEYNHVFTREQQLKNEIKSSKRFTGPALEFTQKANQHSNTALSHSTQALSHESHDTKHQVIHAQAIQSIRKCDPHHKAAINRLSSLHSFIKNSGLLQASLVDSFKYSHVQSVVEHQANINQIDTLHSNLSQLGAEVAAKQAVKPEGYESTWIQTKRILVYDNQTGQPLSWEDGKNTVTSVLTDKNHRNPVVKIKNSNINDGEAFYSGFENYEKEQIKIKGEQSDKYAHTGENSWLVKGRKEIEFPQFNPKTEMYASDSVYLFSAWVKKRGWFWFSKVKVGTRGEEPTIYKWKGRKNWTYIEKVLYQTDDASNKIEIEGKQIYVDDVLLRPLNSIVETKTYDKNDLVTSSTDVNALTNRFVYNTHNIAVVSLNDQGKAGLLKASHYSRNQTEHFTPETPNSDLTIAFQGYSELLPKTRSNAFISRDIEPETEDFALYFSRSSLKNPDLEISVAEVDINIQANTLKINGNSILTGTQHLSDWLLIKTGGSFYCYINGELVKHLHSPMSGGSKRKPISIKGDGIKAVFLGREPIVSATFQDGQGRTIQSQHYTYNQKGTISGRVLFGTLFDGWGNPLITTLPIRDNGNQMAFNPSLISDFSAKTGELTGDVENYYSSQSSEIQGLTPSDSKYAYSATCYENNPMHRLTSNIEPGAYFHQSTNQSRSLVSYSSGTNSDLIDSLLGINQYLKQFPGVSLQTPGNRKVVIKKNKNGQVVGSQHGSSVSSATFEYSDEGMVFNSYRQPNSFNAQTPPSTRSSLYVNTLKYHDLLGQYTTHYDPDEEYIHQIEDHIGQQALTIRSSTEHVPVQQPINMEYFKYDELGRLIEEGVYTARFNFPLIQTMINSGYWDDESAKSYSHWTYNINRAGETQNFHGRLAYSTHQQGKVKTTTFYTYNIEGNITEQRQEITGLDKHPQDYKTQYSYYPNGKLKSIIYPNKEVVTYTYDKLGRMRGVGNPSQAFAYAHYSYDIHGHVSRVDYNNASYSQINKYDLQGQLSEMIYVQNGSELYKMTLYRNNVIGSNLYLMGRISKIVESGSMIGERRVRNFSYDDQYRLTKVEETVGSKKYLYTYSYDANGNIVSCKLPSESLTNYEYVTGKNLREHISSEKGLITQIQTPLWGEATIEVNEYTKMPTRIGNSKNRRQSVNFVYNSHQERVVKAKYLSRKSEVTVYVHGVRGLPLSEISTQKESGQSQSFTKNLIFGVGSAPICTNGNEVGPVFHLRNYQGSLMIVLNKQGQSIAQFEYSPFGNTKILSTRSRVDPVHFSYLYTGQEYDEDLGVYNYRARLYSPAQRQFLSPDKQHSDHSPYLYVSNDPVNHIDLTGETAFNFNAITKEVQQTHWSNIRSEMSGMTRDERVGHFKEIFQKSHSAKGRLETQGRFVATFNHAGSYKAEIHEALESVQGEVSSKIRPGSTNMHEALAVSTAPRLHELGFTVEEIQGWTAPTAQVDFLDRAKNPWPHPSQRSTGRVFANQGETEAHNEIIGIINASRSRNEALTNLHHWMHGLPVNGTSHNYYMASHSINALGPAPQLHTLSEQLTNYIYSYFPY